MSIPDNYSLWEAHDREQQEWLKRRPRCADCDESVQSEYFYLINDEIICPDCMESNYRKAVEDFYE